MAQQRAHDLQLVRARRQVQRRLAALRHRRRRRAARLQQQQHDVLVAHERRHVQTRQARLGRRLELRIEAQQQLHHFDAVLLARHVQRREPVLQHEARENCLHQFTTANHLFLSCKLYTHRRLRVDVGVPLEQQLRHAQVPAVRRHVQRRQVVLRAQRASFARAATTSTCERVSSALKYSYDGRAQPNKAGLILSNKHLASRHAVLLFKAPIAKSADNTRCILLKAFNDRRYRKQYE